MGEASDSDITSAGRNTDQKMDQHIKIWNTAWTFRLAPSHGILLWLLLANMEHCNMHSTTYLARKNVDHER